MKQITTSKRLISNTIINVVTDILTAAIGFLLIRFFLTQLGEQRYGIWVLIGSIFRYRSMLSMGLNSAINRHIPVCLATQDDIGIRKVVSTSFFFFLAVAFILVILSLLVCNKINVWFTIAPEQTRVAGYLVLIVGFCFAIAMPLQLYNAVLSGIQRYDLVNITNLMALLSRTVVLVVMLRSGYGLITMGFVFGISEIVVRLTQFLLAKRFVPEAAVSYRYIDLKLLLKMMTYGTNTILYVMGALIVYKASDVIIGIFIGTAEVSQFSIATAGVLFLSQLTQAYSRAIKPAISDLDARDDDSKIYQIALMSQKYGLLMLIPAGCFFVIMGTDFLNVWVGARINNPITIETMGTVLAIVSISHCVRLMQHSNFVVLVGKGEHKMFGVFTAITAVLFVVIAVICLKIYGLGLVAVAWSNFIPVVLVSGIFLPIYFNCKMKITFKENLVKVWIPALLGTLPAVIMLVLWKYYATPDSWFDIVFLIIATAFVTLMCSWFFTLSKTERQRFAGIVAAKRLFVRK